MRTIFTRLILMSLALTAQQCFCVSRAHGQSATSEVPPQWAEKTCQFAIENADIRGAIEALRKHTGIPICFEGEALDPKTQGISARTRIQQLEARRPALSAAEESDLAWVKEVARVSPEINVRWNVPRHSFDFRQLGIDAMLRQIVGAFDDYSFRWDGAYVIVRPKDSLLDFPVFARQIENSTLLEALIPLAPELRERTIIPELSVMDFWGPDPLTFTIAKLQTDGDMPCWLFLSRLAQATNPPTTWRLDGLKGSRLLTFPRYRRD